jgi:hypothetical protein
MKLYLISVITVVACAGTPSPDELAPRPPDGSALPDASLAVEAPHPQPDAAPREAVDATPSVRSHPNVSGFYCAKFSDPKISKSATRCYRSMENCNRSRVAGQKAGQNADPCEFRDRAYCFGIYDVSINGTQWQCGATLERCEKDLQLYRERYPDPKYRYGPCELTAARSTPHVPAGITIER